MLVDDRCTDLIECPVVEVEATMTVEDACDVSGLFFEMPVRAGSLMWYGATRVV